VPTTLGRKIQTRRHSMGEAWTKIVNRMQSINGDKVGREVIPGICVQLPRWTIFGPLP
jgi:hypothetical protein